MNSSGAPLLQVESLKKYFPVEKGFLRHVVASVKAVDDVSLSVDEGETLGLVGESGCGKTTLGRCILRAIEPTEGSIRFRCDQDRVVEITSLQKAEMRSIRRHIQMIFQDPFSSLDPRMTVLDIIGEPVRYLQTKNRAEIEAQVQQIVKYVGLETKHLKRYPHAFSGGQRQRIGIARALILNPRLVIADEPVSALDVSIRAQILNLLLDLQREFHLTYLFIAHDLSVVQHISDRVAVMYVGKLVEMGGTDALFHRPLHPYTEALLSAVPVPDPEATRKRMILPGEVADPTHPPPGCYFHPRCLYARPLCKEQPPVWEEVRPQHYAACHRARELELRGIG
jgi:peptide/nickel transport system ATP-binding protein